MANTIPGIQQVIDIYIYTYICTHIEREKEKT